MYFIAKYIAAEFHHCNGNLAVRDFRGGSLPRFLRERSKSLLPCIQLDRLAEAPPDTGRSACPPLPWYAIRVQSKYENTASAILRGKGYEEFLPLYRARRRWSDRVKQLDLPLFPGYLFCRLDVTRRLLPVFTTPGVLCIVGAGKSPIPVSEEEIATVNSVLRSGLAAQPWPFVNVGSRVFLERGPLAGVTGIVTCVQKKFRLVVSVQLLQRSLAVEIDRDWARPILDGSGPVSVAVAARGWVPIDE